MGRPVDPIRDFNDIKKICDYLYDRDLKYYTIFMLGIYSGLRVSDLLGLNIEDVENKTEIMLIEQKTQKRKRFPINEVLKPVIENWLKIRKTQFGLGEAVNALFVGKKHGRIEKSMMYRRLNEAVKACGIDNVIIGTHTMRKTFGYHVYKKYKDLALLQRLFNHSSAATTLRYIGIEQEEMDEAWKSINYSNNNKPIKVDKTTIKSDFESNTSADILELKLQLKKLQQDMKRIITNDPIILKSEFMDLKQSIDKLSNKWETQQVMLMTHDKLLNSILSRVERQQASIKAHDKLLDYCAKTVDKHTDKLATLNTNNSLTCKTPIETILPKRKQKVEMIHDNGTIAFLQKYLSDGGHTHRTFAEVALSYLNCTKKEMLAIEK